MRRFNLGAAAAGYQLQPGDSAVLVIGAKHDPAEHPVPDDAGDKRGDPLAYVVE